MSVKGETYARVKAYCDSIGMSMGAWVSELIDENLDAREIRGGGVHLL